MMGCRSGGDGLGQLFDEILPAKTGLARDKARQDQQGPGQTKQAATAPVLPTAARLQPRRFRCH